MIGGLARTSRYKARRSGSQSALAPHVPVKLPRRPIRFGPRVSKGKRKKCSVSSGERRPVLVRCPESESPLSGTPSLVWRVPGLVSRKIFCRQLQLPPSFGGAKTQTPDCIGLRDRGGNSPMGAPVLAPAARGGSRPNLSMLTGALGAHTGGPTHTGVLQELPGVAKSHPPPRPS